MAAGTVPAPAGQAVDRSGCRAAGHGERPSRLRARLLAVFSILVGTAAIGLHASIYGAWIVDDAGITFAYARSVAEGLGPVVQAGAVPVEGFSNPTWTGLLSLGRLVGLFDHGTLFGVPDYVLFPKALALLCCAGLLCACYAAAAKMTSRPWLVTAVVGFGLAAIPSFVIWCFSGLENSLYACLIGALAALLLRAVVAGGLLSYRVAVYAGVLAALAALTRPDGLIYAGAYPIVVLLLAPRASSWGRRVAMAGVSTAAFAVPAGGYFTWRYVEFGRLLSNTSVAKAQSLPGIDALVRPTHLAGYVGVAVTVAFVLIIGLALARPARGRRGLMALLVPLVLSLVAFTVLRPDWMEQYRFATPVWALAVLAGTLGTGMVFARVRHHSARRVLVPVLTVVLAATLVPSALAFAGDVKRFRAHPTLPLCDVVNRFGRVFNGYADRLGLERASVLLPDLGGSALTSRLRLIDMAGLVAPRIADFIQDGDMEGLRDYVFEDVRPTFIHTRPPWGTANGIAFDPRLDRYYYHLYSPPSTVATPSGDWVRKSIISGPRELHALRYYASSTTAYFVRHTWVRPLRDCGATLRPGQTPARVGEPADPVPE